MNRPHEVPSQYGKILCFTFINLDPTRNVFSYETNDSRNVKNVKSSHSVANYEPSLRSRVVSVKTNVKPTRPPTYQEQKLSVIKNKYTGYRSNISNLDDKRFIVPNKETRKKRNRRRNEKANSTSRPIQQHQRSRPRVNQTSAKWVSDLSSLGNLISATESVDAHQVDQSEEVAKLKNIANNADNLIKILNTLKETMNPTNPDSSNPFPNVQK